MTKEEGGRSKAVLSGYTQKIFMETWNTTFRLDLPKTQDMLMPGEQATVRLTMPHSMPVLEGQKFTLRENQITVATGIVVKLCDNVSIRDKSNLKKLDINV